MDHHVISIDSAVGNCADPENISLTLPRKARDAADGRSHSAPHRRRGHNSSGGNESEDYLPFFSRFACFFSFGVFCGAFFLSFFVS